MSLLALPDQIISGVRIYRRTPARLRRREPAMRIGVTVVGVWFTVFFVAIGIRSARLESAAGVDGSWAWSSIWSSAMSSGYLVAAILGPIGVVLFLTRRHRAGLGALGAMFVLAQVVTVAAVL